jgi:hypothetical protein
MTSLFDSKVAIGLACVVAVAVGAGSVVWLRGEGAAPAAAPAAARAGWDGPIGPGVVSAPAPAAPDGPPLTDAAGNLRVDPALHTLFDSYLAKPGGAATLRAYLDHRLAPPARKQAADLADSYVRYLQADDALRARRRHGAVLEQGRNERAQACAQRLLAGPSGERQ